jgi:hypothetical protein
MRWENLPEPIAKRLRGSANAGTRYGEWDDCLMATKQKAVDTPEKAARRAILAENCTEIFAGLTNEAAHAIFVERFPDAKISVQAVESLRRLTEAPHSHSKTVKYLAIMLRCDPEALFQDGFGKLREKWIDAKGRLLAVPKSAATEIAPIDSPVARKLRNMEPLFAKAIHANPGEVVAECEQLVATEYKHLFAYFVYWMSDETRR